MSNIIGYIHICQIGEWKKSFVLRINCIKKFGLYDKSSNIRLGILNPNGIVEKDEILDDPKFDIIYVGMPSEYERPTLLHMRKMSYLDESNTLYYYLHTKGLRHYGTDIELNILDWINLMLYWNIERWNIAVEKLKQYDTYGCNDTGFHYSGNFWWSTSKHIKKLPDSIPSYYTAPEDWIQIVKINKFCVYKSGLQGMGHYKVRYPRTKYVKDI